MRAFLSYLFSKLCVWLKLEMKDLLFGRQFNRIYFLKFPKLLQFSLYGVFVTQTTSKSRVKQQALIKFKVVNFQNLRQFYFSSIPDL